MRPLLLLVLTLPLLACTHPAQSNPPPAAETPPPAAPTEAVAQQDLEKPAVDAGPVAVTRDEVPKVARGEPCTSDAQCDHGLVCEGCSDANRTCIPGCRTNADCASGEHCHPVQCIRCPCPPLCGK